ncbi:ABC transporter related [Alkaliphilus metalliredigens QYMF]|uniref:ABC transporter related n=1 Tax=Alkaliphilus metalliredigens (strain QYMF) TaxID=293826 RepID=A6TN82_ALKMQ|nr:ABC-F type ribosomal protection protein [Alkaliphilus metalliredigens]ABR47650.1 ABC transporter related [Alkaliphilus metalliredigens QYMF]
MIEVSLNGVGKYYGANQVLKNIEFQILKGERVGMVGRNGTGKTTIFKIISGVEKCDGGVFSIRKGAQIGWLEQTPEYLLEFKVIDVLNMAFHKELSIQQSIRELEEKMCFAKGKDLELIMGKYAELQEAFESQGGYNIEEKRSKICEGLGIGEKFKNMQFNDLSGGEKTSVLLGKILLEEPDILLLDEPTNHLDIESIEWLEAFLVAYKGTVIIISHDRYFLDRVVNKIVEIEVGRASTYLGNYSLYMEEKERLYLEELKRYENQQKKIKSMEESIKKLKDWANRGDSEKLFRRAFSMEKRLDKMEKVDRPTTDHDKMKLALSSQERSGQDVVWVEGLYKALEEKILFNDLSFYLRIGEKVAIIGKNGSGKSTFIKTLLGEVSSDTGDVKIGANVKIGYLQQEVYFNSEEHTVLEAFRESYVCTEGEARGILARFLFYSDDVFKKVSNLSGGERSRLRLCQLMYEDVNTLIMDEPTNHLDIMGREMLEEALLGFKGTIMFISHDRYFINRLATRVVELCNKDLVSYLGNYDYYTEKKRTEKPLVESRVLRDTTHTKSTKSPKGDLNNTSTKLNSKKLKEIEEEINKIEALVSAKEEEINANATDFNRLKDLYLEKTTLETSLNKLLDEWIGLK